MLADFVFSSEKVRKYNERFDCSFLIEEPGDGLLLCIGDDSYLIPQEIDEQEFVAIIEESLKNNENLLVGRCVHTDDIYPNGLIY